jgi:hypothetical protein
LTEKFVITLKSDCDKDKEVVVILFPEERDISVKIKRDFGANGAKQENVGLWKSLNLTLSFLSMPLKLKHL